MIKRILFITGISFVLLLMAWSHDLPMRPLDNMRSNEMSDSPKQTVSKIGDTAWQTLDHGLCFGEFDAPIKSNIADSKIQVLRINPALYTFGLSMASAKRCKPKTIEAWCKQENYVAAINAGMFSLKNLRTAAGYMKHFEKVNNAAYKDGFSALAAFNKVKGSKECEFDIIDMHDSTWRVRKENYNSMFQSIRMIDANGKPVVWKAKPDMRSSIVVLAVDSANNVLFLFARSPYTANEFTEMMLKLPLQIRTAMYLEGGPEASLYAKTPSFTLRKYGSFVSKTYETDTNSRFWDLPNVIGIRKKVLASKKYVHQKRK